MADGTRDPGNDSGPTPEEVALAARLRRLGDRLDRQAEGKAGTDPETGAPPDRSGLARAMRLSAEMVGGVIVGAGIGYGIDYLAGTSPWGFIVFFLVGFAGGVLSVMRSAGVLPERKV